MASAFENVHGGQGGFNARPVAAKIEAASRGPILISSRIAFSESHTEACFGDGDNVRLNAVCWMAHHLPLRPAPS